MWGNTMKRLGPMLAWLLAVLIGGIAAAHAQAGYPDRPVKIIVPIGPGGSYDLVGRQLADEHLVAAAFMKAAGVKFLEVPYKDSPPAFTDLLADRIDLFFDSNAAALPYVQSGRARGIAVLSSKRSPLAADVPTMSEAGVPGLDVDSWLGIFVPAKTPQDVIAKLRTDIRASLPDLKERFEKSGGEVWDLPNDRLDAFVASEYENWTKLIREAGIKLD